MGRTMGRSRHSKANVVCLRLTDQQAEQVDIIAASFGLDRSKWLRALVLGQIEDGGE